MTTTARASTRNGNPATCPNPRSRAKKSPMFAPKMVAGALHLAEAGTRMDMALRVRRGRRLERQSMKYENRLRKVPDVTLAFWVIKIAATTLGEPAGIP